MALESPLKSVATSAENIDTATYPQKDKNGIMADTLKQMNEKQQIEAMANDLKQVINRYKAEFELTLVSAIGTLEVLKLELFNEQKNDD